MVKILSTLSVCVWRESGEWRVVAAGHIYNTKQKNSKLILLVFINTFLESDYLLTATV